MKKAPKPISKKPSAKKPAAKKSPTKPKRKAERSELISVLTRIVEGQTRLGDQFGRLTEITNKLVETVGHVGEGVELLLEASERPATQQGAAGKRTAAGT